MRYARTLGAVAFAAAATVLATAPAQAASYTAHPHYMNRGSAVFNSSTNTLKVCDNASDGLSVMVTIEDDDNFYGYNMDKGGCQTYKPKLRNGQRFALRAFNGKKGKAVSGSHGAWVYGIV
ncbi:hypothetical protein OG775_15655 [Streptomyces platensis]|uniref:hypothetical protein n=1 Tax=Streptomyces platensis TaxID=58346 RepID=UPI002251C7AF|nr:hypothetical protein [Streptomyces platensis]MCX4636548.1 hypothetical protein [Streptomyces platensis]